MNNRIISAVLAAAILAGSIPLSAASAETAEEDTMDLTAALHSVMESTDVNDTFTGEDDSAPAADIQEEPVKMVKVTFTGSGGKDGSGQKKTKKGVEYPFYIRKRNGYTYSVSVRVKGVRVGYDYDYALDTYYVLPEKVTGDITIVISKVPTVEVSEYIVLDAQSMYLIRYNGHVKQGQVPMYDGACMYWSEDYGAYVWLMISDQDEKTVKKVAEKAITVCAGEAAPAVDNSGNVDFSGKVDIQDAQLALDIYNGKYTLDNLDMIQFLNADVNADKKVNAADAAAIIHITGMENAGE